MPPPDAGGFPTSYGLVERVQDALLAFRNACEEPDDEEEPLLCEGCGALVERGDYCICSAQPLPPREADEP